MAHRDAHRIVGQAGVRRVHALHHPRHVAGRHRPDHGDAHALHNRVVPGLVSADVEPRVAVLRRAALQQGVQAAHVAGVDRIVGVVDDVVERGEMVPGLDGVVESDLLVRVGEKTPGVVDLTRLLGRQRRTLHMVRVVRHEHLRPIEQRVVDPRVPLVPEPVHKPRPVGHGVLPSLRKHRRGIRVRANRRT